MPFVSGGGGGAAFNGGTIHNTLTIDTSATSDDPFVTSAQHSISSISAGGIFSFEGDDSPVLHLKAISGTDALLNVDGHTSNVILDSLTGGVNTAGNGGIALADGIKSTVITSGALPTTTFVSGTGKQILTGRDVYLVVPCTLNPTAGAAGTVAVALSPDNVTYSALATITEPAGVALDGTIIPASLWVPAGWYVKLTATNATIGTGTYY